MAITNSISVSLKYGGAGQFRCEVDAGRIVAALELPESIRDVRKDLSVVLSGPLNFPPLEQAVISDDRVALVLDHHTPEAPALIRATWDVLRRRDIVPENVVVIQPAQLLQDALPDPRVALPEDVRSHMVWKVHDPADQTGCGYLGSAATGERIYLNRDVIDADVVISIGPISYDPLTGHRGTNSVFYPGLSISDAIQQAHGQGHRELGPDDQRPLRVLIDEVGWMLGSQFSIQVVAAAGSGVAHVLAGAADSVLRRGIELLARGWLIELDTRPEIVLAAIENDAGGHGWHQLGAALATARNLVAGGGKIVVLSEISAEPGQGLELLRQSETARDAIQPLRTFLPPDLVSATQLADAADWANIYLLSHLPSELVEDLFMIPLESLDEASRILRGDENCLFVGSAQHTYGRIRAG